MPCLSTLEVRRPQAHPGPTTVSLSVNVVHNLLDNLHSWVPSILHYFHRSRTGGWSCFIISVLRSHRLLKTIHTPGHCRHLFLRPAMTYLRCNKAVCCCGGSIQRWYKVAGTEWYGLCAPCAREAWRDATKLEEFCDTAWQGSRWASDNWSSFLEEVRRKFGEQPNAVQDEEGDDDDMDL